MVDGADVLCAYVCCSRQLSSKGSGLSVLFPPRTAMAHKNFSALPRQSVPAILSGNAFWVFMQLCGFSGQVA